MKCQIMVENVTNIMPDPKGIAAVTNDYFHDRILY